MPTIAPRRLQATLLERAGRHPTITVTGPRQSGKTTLCRAAFPDHTYVNLEDPTLREIAAADPSSFVARHARGAIFDEVQRVPSLLSAVQVAVDASRDHGRFVLSGSHNFQLQGAIAQSLAGRTSVLDLLPMSHDEVGAFPGAPVHLMPTLFAGGYPRIFDRLIPPTEFHSDYVRTYVERDVRQLLAIQDLGTFQMFLRMCAGRSASLINLSSLASDCGITHPTVKAWIQVLEASYLVKTVQPWFTNLGKRLVKSPKLFFLDSGLLCWLLGIRDADQLEVHPLRGAVFESWVVSEVLKARANVGVNDPIWFYRDQAANEIDVVVEAGRDLLLVEIKSGARVATDAVDRLLATAGAFARVHRSVRTLIIHGGDDMLSVRGVELLPWKRVAGRSWH
ncbi:MAG: ATP-binding protein [Planctomycetes bacterium]|nr:ATP-binding protein [Planctomycetota bacterium]